MLTSEQLDELDSRIQCPVLRPGDAGWGDAVQVWNGMVAKVPALVLQPTSAGDVAAAVRFALDLGLLLSIKGGGHNMAGTSIAERGLALDMSRMREVTVDPDAGFAQVGAGCRLLDVDQATQAYGLATPLGSFSSEVGVAGLTLGGGLGYLTRRFGWTADNLEEVEIVTADGRDPNSHPRARTPTSSGRSAAVAGILALSPGSHFASTRSDRGSPAASSSGAPTGSATCSPPTATSPKPAPRELTAAVTVRLAPSAPFLPEEWHRRPIIGLLVCHSGDKRGGRPRARSRPGRADRRPRHREALHRQQAMLDGMEPKGYHYYWKTEYLDGLSSAFLDTFCERALKVTSPLSESIVIHLEGALNERAGDDGAVGNRDARYMTAFAGQWPADALGDEHVTWVREAWQSVRPFSTGGNYLNFQTAEEDVERLRATYGANFDRLAEVKERYDPDNVFRSNRNIRPRARAGKAVRT